jgi:hypothetical protein
LQDHDSRGPGKVPKPFTQLGNAVLIKAVEQAHYEIGLVG